MISFASLGAIADSTQSGDPFCYVGTFRPTINFGCQYRIDGDLFIFALTRPEPESVDHAVDAGDASFAFAVPAPSVTHVPFVAPATTDHAVNAGDAAFAFAAPEPTVTHTPASSGESVSVTVPLTGVSVLTTYIRWSDNYSLGSLFSADGAEQILSLVDLNSSSPAGRVVISISGINRRFTPAFEASGQIIFEASDGETLEVTIGNADMSEIYQWTPANSLEVVAFVDHIRTLTDQTATLTLREEGVAVTSAFSRDSALDIALGTGGWEGGASDGTTLWFVETSGDARAYVAATRARDSAKDISLGAGDWEGGVSDGTTLWFVEDTSNESRAYVAATRARDSAKDIALGTGSWVGGASDGTTLWFVDNTGNDAHAYVAATRARDSAKDVALGTGLCRGGFSDGTTLWFVKGGDDDEIIAYLASDQSRQSADDITHADLAGVLNGSVYANGIAWFVEPAGDTAIGFRQSGDRAVNAGDAAFAFALPQPSVTHTLAAGTVDHSVNAGDIAFTFALTQPTRTHIQAVADDHAVNAGDLHWGFDVPRPTVTHTTVTTQDHAVNAGDLSWAFDAPEPDGDPDAGRSSCDRRSIRRRRQRRDHRIHRRHHQPD